MRKKFAPTKALFLANKSAFNKLKKLNPVQKKQVKKIVQRRQELKYTIPFELGRAMTSTMAILGMTDNTQGITDQTHIGDRLTLTSSFDLRYSLHVDVGNDAAQQIILARIVCFQWHPVSQSGGATEPAATDVFTVGPSTAVDTLSFYNHDKRQDYTILYDRVHRLVGPGTATSNAYNESMIQYITKKVSLKRARKNVGYIAASSTTATNHLYIAFIANVATDAQNPLISWNAKVFYRDA
jgi:hypothetical protein